MHLIVYRDGDDEVQFMLINAVTGVLLQLLEQNPGVSCEVLVQGLVDSLPQFSAQQIEQGGLEMIARLAEKGIIRQY